MTDKEYLDKAIDFIIVLLDGEDYICERLLDIPEECEICVSGCQNLDKFCIYRFLKHYKIKQNDRQR